MLRSGPGSFFLMSSGGLSGETTAGRRSCCKDVCENELPRQGAVSRLLLRSAPSGIRLGPTSDKASRMQCLCLIL
jgi:hypothetical protein